MPTHGKHVKGTAKPPMHKMPGGHMMSDAEMSKEYKKMEKKGKK